MYDYGPVIARVHRDDEGELTLELIRDEQTVEVADGDQFVTLMLQGNPWALAATEGAE